ncbi:MAG: Rrf2 family transcriptional regulator [Clostridiales bacterium]|nr:Rrf2 family transcriptional regulator [Clostridiales bacterium]
MKLSKKTRYGLRALIDLSADSDSHVSLTSIAERNGISQQYLEQIFSSLKKAGIIKSIKGNQGGYFLSAEPKDISAASIVRALEGDFILEAEQTPADSKVHGITEAIQSCIIDKVNEQLNGLLESTSLEDLKKEFLANRDYNESMYYI